MSYRCAVVNCGRTITEKDSVEIYGERYCKECATLIMRNLVMELMNLKV